MNVNRKIFYLIILMFSLAACSKEESTINLPQGETIISAQIGEEDWKSLDYESALNVIPGKGQYFELSAVSRKYKIKLSVLEFDKFNGTLSHGKYEQDFLFSIFTSDEKGDYINQYKPMEVDENVENPFSIIITASTNSRISGTFSGVVKRVSLENEEEYPGVLSITNGIFNNLPFETHTVNIQGISRQ